ncbi:MAG: hypothetical protein Q9181_007289 [Wetmoreana brouardii]
MSNHSDSPQLEKIEWGAQNHYGKKTASRLPLEKAAEAVAREEPELKGQAKSASYESGLHPTDEDPRPHWTVQYYDNTMNWLGTQHIIPQQVYNVMGFKPQTVEEEEQRVVEKQKGKGLQAPHGKEG